MNDQRAVSFEATGRNPHYKPPIMRWNIVEIVGVRGLEFGIIDDSGGVLTLAVRMSGGKWRDGYEPKPDSAIMLADPDFVFQVRNDDRGPAVDHEYQSDPDNPGECLICKQTGKP